MKFAERFKAEYYDKLLTPTNNNPVRDRATSLLKIFERLDALQKPVSIIESGGLRPDHGDLNFGGDGCASIIFRDFVTTRCDGSLLTTCEINPVNIEYTMGVCTKMFPSVTLVPQLFFIGDSVNIISNSLPENAKFDLIYLDSLDVEQHNQHPAALHALMEFCAVKKYAKHGCLLCIDDSDAFFDGGKTGKATYIREYMKRIGNEPIHDGYQLLYELK